MNEKQLSRLVHGCFHLLTALVCVGVFYVCWYFIGSRIHLDFPANSLGGSIEFPVRLTCTALASMIVALLFKGLVLDLPRQIRRRRFWQRKRAQDAK